MTTQNETGQDTPKRSKLLGVIIIGGFLIALVAGCSILFSVCTGPSDEEEAEERRKGFHCLSSLDGNHRRVVQEVKDYLNDPDSFEAIVTRISPVSGDGNHFLTMDYRARNSFGAMVKAQATATVENDGCEATILSYQ